jgi:iron complex transport system permease protein
MELAALSRSKEQGGSIPERRARHLFWPLLVALCLLIPLCASFGAVHIPVRTILLASMGRTQLSPEQQTILFAIRLPRIFAAALVGSGLSVAGLLFQGLFRNPLADPYVIGSSGGAVLGASIGVFLLPSFTFAGFSATALFAFIGALGSLALVYFVARTHGRTPVVSLLLAGFSVSTMLSYSSYFLEVLDRDLGTGMRVLTSWLHGAISTPTWNQIFVIAFITALGTIASVPLCRLLDTLALGEEYAQHLGVNVELARGCLILVGSLLTAAAVALGGMIGFVGLIIPHLARMIAGPDHVRLLPLVACMGAIFVMLTDTLARTLLTPAEIPVGVLMAFVGGPFFLFVLRRAGDSNTL